MLRSIYFTLLLLATALAQSTTAYANHHEYDNHLSPIGRLAFNPEFWDGSVAVGLLGEAGNGTARGNASLAFSLPASQRIKIGGEFLTQKLGFNFKDGHVKQWVPQWAVGGKYQASIDYCFLRDIRVDIAYSSAISQDLKEHHLSNGSTLYRHIAGSEALEVGAGISLKPWCGALITILADYDHVKFKNKYDFIQNLKGFGGTAILNQRFFNCFDLNLRAEVRKPYNYYRAEILKGSEGSLQSYTLGIFGCYTQGKYGLPNVSTGGVMISYDFGSRKNCCKGPTNTECCTPTPCSSLASWVLEPAVYMPIVLAVSDQRKISPVPPPVCIPAALVSQIPDQLEIPGAVYNYDVSSYFTGTNLIWSVVSADPSQVTASVNSAGVVLLTFVGGLGQAGITVTATNGCGSAADGFSFSFQTG